MNSLAHPNFTSTMGLKKSGPQSQKTIWSPEIWNISGLWVDAASRVREVKHIKVKLLPSICRPYDRGDMFWWGRNLRPSECYMPSTGKTARSGRILLGEKETPLGRVWKTFESLNLEEPINRTRTYRDGFTNGIIPENVRFKNSNPVKLILTGFVFKGQVLPYPY